MNSNERAHHEHSAAQPLRRQFYENLEPWLSLLKKTACPC